MYLNINEPLYDIEIVDALNMIKSYVINNQIDFTYIKFIKKYSWIDSKHVSVYKIRNFNNNYNDMSPEIIFENIHFSIFNCIVNETWNINRPVQQIGKMIRISHNIDKIKINTKKLLDENKNKKNYNQNSKHRKY